MVELEVKSAGDLLDLLDDCDEDTPWEDIKMIMDRLDDLDPQLPIPTEVALADLRRKFPAVFHNLNRGRRQRHRASQPFIIAAVLVAALLVMACAVFPNLFDMFIDKDTFIISGRLELETPPLGEDMYVSLEQALVDQQLPNVSPKWIPERFSISWVKVDEFEAFTNCSAWYLDNEDQDKGIFARVTRYADPGAIQEKFEAEDGTGRSYTAHGTEYYITENHGNPRAM